MAPPRLTLMRRPLFSIETYTAAVHTYKYLIFSIHEGNWAFSQKKDKGSIGFNMPLYEDISNIGSQDTNSSFFAKNM